MVELERQKITATNKQFGVMAGERPRLNIFGLLKIRSSIEVYRLKSATNAKRNRKKISASRIFFQLRKSADTNVMCKFNRHYQNDK